MIIAKVITGIIGYIIISIAVMMLFIYADRKAGETAQKVYDDEFYEYCVAGFLFPISIPCIVIVGICKFIKIMCVAIIETKIAIEENKE